MSPTARAAAWIGGVTLSAGVALATTEFSPGVPPHPRGLFALGVVPQAVASIYQEASFSEAKVNVLFMLAFAALGQFLFLIAVVREGGRRKVK